MEDGMIARQPIEPLARLLLGAVTEAAVACAGRSDVLKAGSEYGRAFKSLIEALRLR
jgi:hypothetical protein